MNLHTTVDWSADLPISSNPSIEKNSTHLSLFWSPPFLWPGQRIDYYNISFINKSDSSIAYYTVNSTFRDRVVKFTRMIHENDIMCKRTEIEFFISAFNVSGYPLPSFNISDWITPTRMFIQNPINNKLCELHNCSFSFVALIDIQSNNWSAAINITLLKNSSTLYLIVDFEVHVYNTIDYDEHTQKPS